MSCEVLSEKIVKTKKPHFCFACSRSFPAGSTMKYQANIFDGDFGSLYVCETCQELMDKANDYLWDDFEMSYPENCVGEALSIVGYKTPEEWLQSIS
jgi:hypothetical protein